MASRDLVVHLIGDDESLQRAYKRSAAATKKLDREISQTFRGAAAGSGVFKTLGRSLAFASGGFIAAASVTEVLRGSIHQATEAAKVQGQLAAQFQASGQNLRRYQAQIDETSNKLSVLAGIENDELKAAFVTAFRGTENVSTALKIQAIAADVARGRNVSLNTATIALTKGFLGQATALKRLGIIVPSTLHGMSALNFVQAKFAGQAAAGTTAQERFTAAFKNMEEAIGTALLPTFNKLLTAVTKWLSSTENQKKVQDTTKETVSVFGALAGAAVNLGRGLVDPAKKVIDFAHALGDLNGQIETYLKRIYQAGHGPGIAPSTMSGQNVSDRIFGRAPTGPGAFPVVPVFPGGAGAAEGRLSLQGQMNRLEMQLAKALTTIGTADDRALLVMERHLIGRLLAHTKDWKVRRQLYEDLGRVDQQIAAIDDKAAADRKEAHDKELEAQRKKREALAEHNRKLREAWQAQLAKIREAVAEVRSEFGQLPFEASPTGILGVTGQSAKSFVGAYVNQTRAFVAFYNDLSRLRRMGAPRGLVDQLRGLGPDAAGLIHSLGRHPGQLNRLIRAFGERERVVQQIAHADIHARNVVVHVAGSRVGTTSASQRRGRQAGVPTSIGAWASGGHS